MSLKYNGKEVKKVKIDGQRCAGMYGCSPFRTIYTPASKCNINTDKKMIEELHLNGTIKKVNRNVLDIKCKRGFPNRDYKKELVVGDGVEGVEVDGEVVLGKLHPRNELSEYRKDFDKVVSKGLGRQDNERFYSEVDKE